MDIIRNKEIKVLHSIISCESSDVINSEQFIHCWDGNDFFELTSFKYPKNITDRSTGKNILTGMQIIAKGIQFFLFCLIYIYIERHCSNYSFYVSF